MLGIPDDCLRCYRISQPVDSLICCIDLIPFISEFEFQLMNAQFLGLALQLVHVSVDCCCIKSIARRDVFEEIRELGFLGADPLLQELSQSLCVFGF